nr:uncharacterized protein LOC118879732 [Drosophila suzukii]
MSSRKEHNLSAVRLPVRRGLHKDLWDGSMDLFESWAPILLCPKIGLRVSASGQRRLALEHLGSQDAIRYIVGFWGQTVAAVDVSDCPLDRSPASASRKETHQPPPAGCNSHTKGFT